LALTVRHVLILRALGLGDFLTGVPAYRALRWAYRDAVLTLAAPGYLEPLVALTGAIDRLLPTDGLSDLRPAQRPELAVNLHGRGPQSIDVLLRTDAEKLITHRHPLRSKAAGPDWQEDLHEVRRWCRLLELAGVPADPDDLQLSRPSLAPFVSGAIVVHPGAAFPARRWPAERFGAVARQLGESGHPIVVTGTRAEKPIAEVVISSGDLPASSNLCGELDLDQLAASISSARLLISGDTGVAHLASAYGTPSVVLFGPTPPSQWGPPSEGPHTVLWRGSTGDPHADQPDAGLLSIAVPEVVRAARARLQLPADSAQYRKMTSSAGRE
jgi:ADP-heptose:LPS heptosyltransferase